MDTEEQYNERMNTMRPNSALNKQEVQAKLELLNLDPIKIKLMDKEEGEGWNREQADRVERLYKRFLYLTATSTKVIVPTKEIDAFWHQHILDTRKYAQDCDALFGYFLHHFPYFGMRGSDDAAALSHAYESTCELYASEFGDEYEQGKEVNCSSCGSGSCGSCSSQCAGSKCSGSADSVMNTQMRPTFAV